MRQGSARKQLTSTTPSTRWPQAMKKGADAMAPAPLVDRTVC
jgi:hypothetical protein